MKMLLKLCTAFCAATVIAQLIILAMMAIKGNLNSTTLTQALAIINGIDVTGDQIERVFQNASEIPVPSHEEILIERARMSVELQNQQNAIQKEKESVSQLLAELVSRNAEFDRRRQEFFAKVDQMENKLVEESLQRVQMTLEELSAEQAKDQLIRMLAAERMDDVVTIIKVMDPAKRKKVLGEFADREDTDKLHEMLMRMLAGEPMASTLKDQRKSLADSQR
jgi:CRISPR/Cas system CSM-associated protein Csm2 small subunit